MSIAKIAEDSYNESGNLYKTLFCTKKALTEVYTALKYLRDSTETSAEGLKILDLGCGNGDFLLFVLNQGAEFVSGMDISQTMINSSFELLKSIPESKFSLKVGNCLDSEVLVSTYSEVKFDNIIANWLIGYAENFEVLKQFFIGCRSILKPDGRIFGIFANDSLIDFTEESMSKMHVKSSHYAILSKEDEFARADVTFLDLNTGAEMFKVQINVFRKEVVRRALNEAGFEVVKLGPVEVSDRFEEHGYTLAHFRAYTDEVGVVNCFSAKVI